MKDTNGFALAPAATETSLNENAFDLFWRQTAMDEALRCSAREGAPQHLLLAHLQRHLPRATARVFWEDRATTLEAARQLLPDLWPILTPGLKGGEEGEESDGRTPLAPVFGWWRGRRQGACASRNDEPFELILAPDFFGSGDWIVAGSDASSVNELVDEIVREANRHRCRCRRFAGGWIDDPAMAGEVEKVSWDDIVLPAETLSDLQGTITRFFEQKETFRALRFPWRRGILLVGPPGTGKTMVCKAAAASYSNLPFLSVGEIGRRSNTAEIEQVFAHARKSAPCILAFEDMDGLIDKSNRTVFLNELDGFRDNDGLLIIASSNHPERIDEALLKRPSRFDRVYHIGLPALAEREEYCRRLLARAPNVSPALDTAELAARVAGATDGFTPAFLKEALLSAMLQMVHENIPELGEPFGAAVIEQVELLRKYLKKAKNPEALAELAGSAAAGENIGFRAR